MTSQYLLSLDQGTTSSRALLFDTNGQLIESYIENSSLTHKQIYPNSGWVEHNAIEIWENCLAAIKNSTRSSDYPLSSIAALGITNQRETTVIWNKKTGKPIYNAIVWQDRRTANMIDTLKNKHSAEVSKRSGLVLDAYFSASKIGWILDHVDGAREQANAGELAFGTIDSWLIWNLTSGKHHVTDHSNASRTLLYNIAERTWDSWLCNLFDVPMSMLPTLVPSSGIIAHTDSAVIGAEIPIAGIAGDQQAATFGHICTQPGSAKNTYGSGCFLVTPTLDKHAPSQHKLLSTVAWEIDGAVSYALEGSIFTAGSAINWAARQMNLGGDGKALSTLAEMVEDNDGVYFVPALAGLGAPHWNQYAQGTWFGITAATERGHLARAVLEGIAFQVVDMMTAMQQDTGHAFDCLYVDGGVCQSDVLMQFQADILNIPVLRPAMVESTALGVAYLAGLAVGIWKDEAALKSLPRQHTTFTPRMDELSRARLLAQWKHATQCALLWGEQRSA